MLAEDRLNRIVSMVHAAGSVTVPELADSLGVTASTIRRDLATLDKAHRIAKVHGGAMSLERAHVTRDLTLTERSEMHNDEKERICQAAAELVEPGSFVYIDSGSTTLRLIDHLPQLAGVTYVTDAIAQARRLMVRGFHVIMLGGTLKAETESVVGPDACAMLHHYNFTVGFWGANAISLERGFTAPDIAEAEVKGLSMQRAVRRYVLADASKFDMVAPVTFVDFADANIITAGTVPESYRACENITLV